MPSGAAGVGSKSGRRGGHGSRRRALEGADVCLPRPKARAKRWSLRANGHRNSHCVPTVVELVVGVVLVLAMPRLLRAGLRSPARTFFIGAGVAILVV